MSIDDIGGDGIYTIYNKDVNEKIEKLERQVSLLQEEVYKATAINEEMKGVAQPPPTAIELQEKIRMEMRHAINNINQEEMKKEMKKRLLNDLLDMDYIEREFLSEEDMEIK